MFIAQVTDDTEQLMYMLDEYINDGEVSINGTVTALKKWVEETDPVPKGYVGPSSEKAMKAMDEGVEPVEAGKNGTTCGAAMRILSAVLQTKSEAQLADNIWKCCVPTHNTSLAIEPATVLALAFYKALNGGSYEEILAASIEASTLGQELSKDVEWAGALAGSKVKTLMPMVQAINDDNELLDFVHDVCGTGMESNDVVPAVLLIFSYAKDDVWLAIKLASSVGGDTDTIAALVGALSSIYANGHNIPKDIVEQVINANNLDFSKYC